MAIVAGIDAGSTRTKVVIIKNGNIINKVCIPTKKDMELSAKLALKKCIKKLRIEKNEINYIVATGYGRKAIKFSNNTISEIIANVVGVKFLASSLKRKVRTIIDLGGQDSKVISLDENENIQNFVMNDKCSAGTGKFLENISRILGVKLEDLGKISIKSKNPIEINSTCTVFAESELISLLAQKKKTEDIICGIHFSIAKKLISLANQVGVKDVIVFDGGGAKNLGIKVALENLLKRKIYVPSEPEFVVALGAALIGEEYARNNR
ncbi:MAG: acyl-CoA dehydratase activase [Candidatus Aenigmatarchaeota archaeon]